ncbi:MAG: hypothetical protein GEV09_12645 [Pseudonocardiaceae bacterium]|nr:hypothetical protein [Pseudonocardiaceae bacterium]
MTTTQPNRRYRIGDQVTTPGDTGDTNGEIVDDTLTPEQYNAMVERGHYGGDLHGTGPLYIVNEGGVFLSGGVYEAVYAETQLEPHPLADLIKSIEETEGNTP